MDDPLTGDRQFWSGGVGFDPPSPCQQDQDGMAVVFILVLIEPTGYCISLELKPASDCNKKTCAALFYSLVLCEIFGNLLIYCSAPCLACGDVSVASYFLCYLIQFSHLFHCCDIFKMPPNKKKICLIQGQSKLSFKPKSIDGGISGMYNLAYRYRICPTSVTVDLYEYYFTLFFVRKHHVH